MLAAVRPDQARRLADIFDDENIGGAIARIRQEISKQSQADFAPALDLTRDQLAFIETGRTSINTRRAWSLCKKFNIHPAWLMSKGMEEIPPKFDSIPAGKIVFFEKKMLGGEEIPFRQFWKMLGWVITDKHLNVEILQKIKLTDAETYEMMPEVKAQLPRLLERLNRATKESGKMSALADYLAKATGQSVPLASVSRWLSGKREPGGEITLRLLQWVEQQERQTKKP